MPKWEYYLRVVLVQVYELARLVFNRDGLSWVLTFIISLGVWVVPFVIGIALFGEERPYGEIYLPNDVIVWPIILATLFFVFAPALFEAAKRVKRVIGKASVAWYENQQNKINWYKAVKKKQDTTVADDFPADIEGIDGRYAEDPNSGQQVKKGK